MRTILRCLALVAAALLGSSCHSQSDGGARLDAGSLRAARGNAPARGPLRTFRENSRYFTDGSGGAVFLTGSHTWDNRQDVGGRPFDWPDYVTRIQQYNHNFVRLWVWEQPQSINTWPVPAEPLATLSPELFVRTGPGTAADGGLKFDLSKHNEKHFARLRERIIEARDRGIYVSVMLFDGWSVEEKSEGANPWIYHPFNRINNINSIDGDPNSDQSGSETQTLQIPAVTRLQEAYLRKVVDTVSDLDNVLYEVSNESKNDSLEWQYHTINYLKSYEATKAKQHPVGMTIPVPHGSNESLFHSPADWISPNESGGYRDNPPVATGTKVIVTDTDHLWGIGGDRAWAWKSFLRGLNVIYMDPWESQFIPVPANVSLRENLGYLLFYAKRINLATMAPYPRLASTGYCLAQPGRAYLVYIPGVEDGSHSRIGRVFLRNISSWLTGWAEVDLSGAEGDFSVEWLNPRTGEVVRAETARGGRKQRFTARFGGDAVLYIWRRG